jgi:hypothetical protein
MSKVMTMNKQFQMSEAGFSGLKDLEDFFIPNPVYSKIL